MSQIEKKKVLDIINYKIVNLRKESEEGTSFKRLDVASKIEILTEVKREVNEL